MSHKSPDQLSLFAQPGVDPAEAALLAESDWPDSHLRLAGLIAASPDRLDQKRLRQAVAGLRALRARMAGAVHID